MYGMIKGAGVAIALALATITGSAATANTFNTLTGDYDVSSAQTGSNMHSLWLPGLGSNAYWQFDNDGGLFTWDGRRARLRGTLTENGTPANTLDLDVIFDYRPEGRGDRNPKNPFGADTTTWDFFDLDRATLMGTVAGNAVSLDLSIRPGDGELPAQLGLAANDKDRGLGFSSWIYYNDGSGNRVGDINIRLSDQPIGGPSPIPLPASGMLMLAGLGAAGFVARRRAKA